MSWSDRWIFEAENCLAMMLPSLTALGSCSQRVRPSAVFFSEPAAMVVRRPTWVRLGPVLPPDTPSIVWQVMHWLDGLEKTCRPRAASPLGALGAVRWAR